MSEMPDLSKIVSLIMENPELISKIQGLAKGDEEKAEEPKKEATVEPVAAASAIPDVPRHDAREKRNRLLYAMKPYLSSERAKAIDSMMSVADILDMIKTR